jgi:hypothetical protein
VSRSEDTAPPCLTSALDEVEWSALLPGRFTPGEKAPGTNCIGDWVGPRDDLDVMEKTKIPTPAGNRSPAVQLVACRYTDWVIPTLMIDLGFNYKKVSYNESVIDTMFTWTLNINVDIQTTSRKAPVLARRSVKHSFSCSCNYNLVYYQCGFYPCSQKAEREISHSLMFDMRVVSSLVMVWRIINKQTATKQLHSYTHNRT